jgi:transposase-like protein
MAQKGRFEMSKKRRSYPPQLKARLAIEALREERSVSEIASENNINPNMLRKWRDELTEGAASVFDTAKQAKEQKRREEALAAERDELLKTIGTATVERDWLRRVYKDVNGGQEPPSVGQIRD